MLKASANNYGQFPTRARGKSTEENIIGLGFWKDNRRESLRWPSELRHTTGLPSHGMLFIYLY
jgi:hypothetical protein